MDPKLNSFSGHVGVILGSFWGQDGIILGSFWGHIGFILGSFWGHDGIILGSFWGHVGIILGSFWGHVGVILASCWYQRISPKCCGADFGSRIKISGNLLGQNDQNFEIYPFDWSQVASWGLAAEGEALTIFFLYLLLVKGNLLELFSRPCGL